MALSAAVTLAFLLLRDNSNQQINRAGVPSPDSINKADVEITADSLKPADLTVNKGTRVVWTNVDSEEHRLISNIFGSNNLKKNQSWSYLFEEAGEYTYHCAIHPDVEGKVTVK